MRFLPACLLALLAACPAMAQIDSAPKVQARLIAETGEIAPGGSVTVALEQNIRPGWHTYWVNPGEAGLPTELKWSRPPGWRAGSLRWPYPSRLPVGPLMNYGYEGKVWLLTTLTAPRDAKPGDLANLEATASFLVCKEVCIPEDHDVSLPLAVVRTPAAPYPTIAGMFAAARSKIPAPWSRHAAFSVGKSLDLFLASSGFHGGVTDAAFFPLTAGEIVDFAPQHFAPAAGGIVLRLVPAKHARLASGLSGVVVLKFANGHVQSAMVNASPGPVPQVHFAPHQKSSAAPVAGHGAPSLALALLFALVGGAILNLMPCVLPVLAMKALAIANSAHRHPKEAASEGIAYGGGAVLSFLGLGVAIAVLRAGGQAVGWGFQLQDPVTVACFALLIFVVGLNLSGVFEVPGIGAGENLTRRGGAIGAFFTGVLAVAVAAPCTAPFMAAALGYALTQPTGASLLVFLTLGIGFAFPFVLIGMFPGLTRVLPKPGAWMLRLRQLLAFPMYGTALWLLWVLSFETGPSNLLVVPALALTLAFALWIFSSTRGRSTRWSAVGWVALLLGIAALPLLLPVLAEGRAAAHELADISSLKAETYTPRRLAELRAQHRPVFVNATAAWCITCLVNEKAAFSDAAVQHAFAQKAIAYMVADWTNRNPDITALLQAHARDGVPLYLYYASDSADAVVLPQVLTPGDVLKAIGA
jgi:thiol:disulfide interchange protein DsbD